MAQSIGIKSQADGSAFVYVEDAAGNSLAFGSDNTANTFVLNTSNVPNIIPNDATSNIQFDPATNGDITFMPNGTGNSVFATNNVSIVDGSLLLPATSNAGDIGCIFSGGSRVISFPDDFNIYIGKGIGGVGTYPNVVGVVYNICIGSEGVLNSLTGAASNNIAIGRSVLNDLLGDAGTPDEGNIGIGAVTLSQLTNGSNNIAIGVGALSNVLTGISNICIGPSAGDSYNSSESANIIIGTEGVVGDNSIIRIGDPFPGSINETYIAGIYGVTPADPAEMVIIDDNGQLGSQTLPTGEITITGDTGGPLTSDSFTFTGGVANTGTISFSGSGTTLSLLVTDASTNTIIGAAAKIPPAGGGGNTVFGPLAFAANNVTSSAVLNQGLGYQCFYSITTGSRNSAFGQQPLLFLTTGNYNLAIGAFQVGVNYTSSETSNILIGSPGVTGDSNTIRIGDQGTGNAQQNQAFIAGVQGVTPSGGNDGMVIIDSSGQLGSQTQMVMPLNPAFLACPSATLTDVTGDGTDYTTIFATEIFDQGGNYNTGTGTFTAPVTGKYSFYVAVAYSDLTVLHTSGNTIIVTSNRQFLANNSNLGVIQNSGFLGLNNSVICDMDAADTCTFHVQVAGSTKTVDVFVVDAADPRSWFGGNLVC